MTKDQIIYVASPYSSGDPEQIQNNYEMVTEFVAMLVSMGYIAISPITYGHTLLDYQDMPKDYGFCKHFCIGLLKKSDAILVLKLPGWEDSVGVQDEMDFARKNHIEVYLIDSPDVLPITKNIKLEIAQFDKQIAELEEIEI